MKYVKSAAIAVATYLGMAFFLWDLNPANWDAFGRGAFITAAGYFASWPLIFSKE